MTYCDCLFVHLDVIVPLVELLSPAEMDGHLQQMESGVELALDRAKVWSKYAKDVITYIEKRTLLGKSNY